MSLSRLVTLPNWTPEIVQGLALAKRAVDGDIVDPLAGNLAAAAGVRAIKQACRAVERALEGKGARARIIAGGHVEPGTQPERAVDLLPVAQGPSPFYEDLDFGRGISWTDLLDLYPADTVY